MKIRHLRHRQSQATRRRQRLPKWARGARKLAWIRILDSNGKELQAFPVPPRDLLGRGAVVANGQSVTA